MKKPSCRSVKKTVKRDQQGQTFIIQLSPLLIYRSQGRGDVGSKTTFSFLWFIWSVWFVWRHLQYSLRLELIP